jgi:hypothetical protein
MFALDVYMAAVYPAGPDPMIRQLTFSIVEWFMVFIFLSAKVQLLSLRLFV